MALKYNVQLNNGVEAFGTGKSITANEVCETADNNFVAHHLQLHTHGLITEDIAKIVLDNFCETVAELVGQGYAVQLCKGGDVMLRIYPDIHLNGDNINLGRAQQLDPSVTDLTLENAGDLAARVGVTVRPRAQVTQKFADLLDQKKAAVERVAVVEKPFVERTGSNAENPGTTTPTTPASGDDPNSGND
jgi:hypothetical protein